MEIVKKFMRSIRSTLKKRYAHKVRKMAKEVGANLQVNVNSYVTPTTILGENVNFNGMRISGKGKVTDR